MLLPTTRPEAPRDTGVPDMVIAEAPGMSVVVSATMTPSGLTVNDWPAIVVIILDVGLGVGRL